MNKEALKKLKDDPLIISKLFGYKDHNQTHAEWIKLVWCNGEDKTLQAHRNSYKTTTVLIIGVIWYLIFNPDKTVLFLRKSDDKASGILDAIVKHMKSNQYSLLIKKLFDINNFHLSSYNSSKLYYPFKKTVTKEKSIEAFGINTDMTGSHFDRIICDDIITAKDRYSKAEREQIKNKVRELHNIKNASGKIAVIGTPWHKQDAFSILPEAKKYPLGSVSIKELTEERVESIRRKTTASLFAANYLLRHINEDTRVFNEPQYDRWLAGVECRAYLDPAYSGKDTTALTLIQQMGDMMIVKGYVWDEHVVELVPKIVNIIDNNKCGTIYVEINKDEGFLAKEIEKLHPAVTKRRETMNKHNKIISYAKYNWDSIYFDMDINEDYFNQIMDYEEGQEPDDAPDSLACLVRELKGVSTEVYEIAGDVEMEYKY